MQFDNDVIGGNVVDVTTDGGRHWYSTAFPGDLVSRPEWPATTTPDDIEVAVTAATSVGARSHTAWYASTNQGRSWKLTAIS